MSDRSPSVQVVVNGERHEVPAGLALTGFISHLGLAPETVLIEFNGLALLRMEWQTRNLAEGDRLEILRVVAGG